MDYVPALVCVAALAVYGWAAVVTARYSAPWSAPWRVADRTGGGGAAFNAAARGAVLGVLVAAFAWPYAQLQPSPEQHYNVPFRPLWPVVSTGGSSGVTWLLVAIALSAVAVGVFLVARFLFATRPDREALGADQLKAVGDQTLSALTGEALLAMMAENDPRRAILACYAQMELSLARRGIPRRPEETAPEYARRLLELAGAPAGPLGTLTKLFQLAGFSTQRMDETMRDNAIAALHAIGGSTA